MVKAFLYLLLLLFVSGFVPGCASVAPSPAPADTPADREAPLWLQQAFPNAQIESLVYSAQYSGQLKAFSLVFDADQGIDVSTRRRQIQNTLMAQFTERNHPEGNCVQVEHALRAKKDVFEILVVCVG